jgi:hypothetical protein
MSLSTPAMGRRSIAHLILDLDIIRWGKCSTSWSGRFTRGELWYPMNRRICRPQNLSRHSGTENISCSFRVSKPRIVQPVANQHVTKLQACIGTLWFIIAGICEQRTQTQATFYTLATQLPKIPSQTTSWKAGVWVPPMTMVFLFVTTPKPTLVPIYTTIIMKMTIYWTRTWRYTFIPTHVFMSLVFRLRCILKHNPRAFYVTVFRRRAHSLQVFSPANPS